ncbi:MAG: hypothetical protein R2820_03685 [Cyclobacteriaceae bacterium]|nr:hypothetical protein [Cyclobacteriaceae bacterium]
MAKATAKKVAKKTTTKSATAKPAKKASAPAIDKVMQQVLDKLSKMKADQKLQDDIKWCLGSYGHDKNPVGLKETGQRALKYFSAAKAKNAKAVPAKLMSDLEKVAG